MSTPEDFDGVRFEVDDGIASITIDRPEAGNALTSEQRVKMGEWLARADEDLAIRCVVLQATGRFFCTGADLSGGAPAMASPRPADAPERVIGERRRMMLRGAITTVNAILDCEVPVIAKVQGTAAGIGAHLAFACDLVIVSENAKFIEVFARRALAADGLGTWLLPRLVGLQRAKELILLAEDISATRGLRDRARRRAWSPPTSSTRPSPSSPAAWPTARPARTRSTSGCSTARSTSTAPRWRRKSPGSST